MMCCVLRSALSPVVRRSEKHGHHAWLLRGWNRGPQGVYDMEQKQKQPERRAVPLLVTFVEHLCIVGQS